MKTGIPVELSFAKWRQDPAYIAEYDALEKEFTAAAALIDARLKAKLSQEEVAKRMKTSQAAVARLESGKSNPRLDTINRFAKAVGTKARVVFE